ncbi:hypothetical protein M2281_003590 [Mesorhizobium soli]|uniref:transposase n=1 Tax=Pseudaminobacter soli (ex Li et al. 2025) TaxID=1295366 RepID=UPI00247B35AC|nr:hypothetical protein [Mesorhizobium soli]
MAHLSGTDRSQLLLLPEAVDDYVGPDNPVRFIEASIDGLDLCAAGFVPVRAKETGRPGYDPADLLKLYIYGYVNRVRSRAMRTRRRPAATAVPEAEAATWRRRSPQSKANVTGTRRCCRSNCHCSRFLFTRGRRVPMPLVQAGIARRVSCSLFQAQLRWTDCATCCVERRSVRQKIQRFHRGIGKQASQLRVPRLKRIHLGLHVSGNMPR